MSCSACEGRRATLKGMWDNGHWHNMCDTFDGYDFAWDVIANMVAAALVAVVLIAAVELGLIRRG